MIKMFYTLAVTPRAVNIFTKKKRETVTYCIQGIAKHPSTNRRSPRRSVSIRIILLSWISKNWRFLDSE